MSYGYRNIDNITKVKQISIDQIEVKNNYSSNFVI